MALPQGFVLEQPPPGGMTLPPGFELEPSPVAPAPSGIPAPRRAPTMMGGLARGAASLADVTVGGVLPAAVQTFGYPVLRATGQTPEQAAAATQRMVQRVEQPFGRAFGVTETPEYQQEASRRLMDFIGQNFQKGAAWIAQQTGLPQPDVENMMGTAALGAPKAITAGARGVRAAAETPLAQDIRAGLQLPLEPTLQARRERLSAESYARGPQLDAAKEAQRLGLALNPADIQPTAGPRLKAALAGQRGEEAIQQANRPQINVVARQEMGLPPTAQLNDPKSFDTARAKIAAPYDKIKQIPVIQADDSARAALERLRPAETMIGGEASAAKINALIDSALKQVDAGMSGQIFLDNISKLRKDARRIYRNKNAGPEQIDIAETNLAVANVLEGMIEKSVFDPRLLADYRAARQKMAQIYAYEAATDFNTGFVDPAKIARLTAKDNALTGDIAAIGRIAGNFPGAFYPQPGSPWYTTKVSRAGFGGAGGAVAGGALGSAVGLPVEGTIVGTMLGGLAGEFGSKRIAGRIASPEYQAGLRVPDYRIPVVNQLAGEPPIPQNRALVPYTTPQELLMPGEGPYQPNFVFAQPTPQARFVGPEAGPPQLPAPSAEATLATLRAEDARRAAMSRTLGREAEARQAAAEAAARRPAGEGVPLVFDEAGNLVPAPTTGAGGLMPTALESAVQKLSGQMVTPTETQFRRVSTGKWEKKETAEGPKFYVRGRTAEGPSTREPQAFALTAEEKIAWDRAKASLADVAPGFKALDDKAIVSKMMNRQWAEETAVKAREKAAAFEQIAARAKDAQARRDALAKREQLLDALDLLEQRLSQPRPVELGGQGPKTRAAKRNALSPQSTNKLVD